MLFNFSLLPYPIALGKPLRNGAAKQTPRRWGSISRGPRGRHRVLGGRGQLPVAAAPATFLSSPFRLGCFHPLILRKTLKFCLFGRISGSILRRSFERPYFEGISKENARLLFDCDIVGAPFVPCWSGLTSDGDELSNPSSRPRRSPRVTDSSAHSYNAPQYYPLILPKTRLF